LDPGTYATQTFRPGFVSSWTNARGYLELSARKVVLKRFDLLREGAQPSVNPVTELVFSLWAWNFPATSLVNTLRSRYRVPKRNASVRHYASTASKVLRFRRISHYVRRRKQSVAGRRDDYGHGSTHVEEAVEPLEKANADLEPELLSADAARTHLAFYARAEKLAAYAKTMPARKLDDATEVALTTGGLGGQGQGDGGHGQGRGFKR
jgi:hypothetical protein